MARLTWATPGGVRDRQVALVLERRGELDGQFPVDVRVEDFFVGQFELAGGRCVGHDRHDDTPACSVTTRVAVTAK